MNDLITDAGEAFLGQGISDAGGTGNVQLWNGCTGNIVYLDRIIIAGDQNVGADVRYTRAPIGIDFPGHARNKNMDGTDPKASIRIHTGTPPNDYPYNRPVQEVWLGGTLNDRTYLLDPPIRIPQGRGVVLSMAGSSKAIVSFQWREKCDPQGAICQAPLIPSVDDITSDLINAQNAFDGDDSTYANDAETLDFYIGKFWSTEKNVTRVIMKSQPARSFSGASPGRVYQWELESFDGTAWTTQSAGTYTEPGSGTTQSILDIPCSLSSLGLRVRMTDSAIAAHRVAQVEFLA